MNLYALLGGAVMWAFSLAGAGWWAFETGRDVEIATQYRESAAAQKASQVAAAAAAAAIGKMEVQRVEITQPVLREVREKTVYRDCRHSPDGLRGINAALTGITESVGTGELPAAPSADR